jgi:hypothetical protein
MHQKKVSGCSWKKFFIKYLQQLKKCRSVDPSIFCKIRSESCRSSIKKTFLHAFSRKCEESWNEHTSCIVAANNCHKFSSFCTNNYACLLLSSRAKCFRWALRWILRDTFIQVVKRRRLYRVSQEECARLRENISYIKVHRYNPKHLYPKLNGYWDNGQKKVWFSCGSTYCTC